MYKQEHDLPFVLTVKDIQTILKVGRNNAYDLMNSGEFKTVKIGRQIRVSRSVFLDWLNGKEGIA